jgi:hypothetical protein
LSRRVWLIALCLYALAAAADVTVHAYEDVEAGQNWLDPANFVVALSAGMFWPIDLIARYLLGR